MGYRMKYTGEEVEHRLDKVEANEESIAAIEGRVTEAEEKITEAEGKIAEVDEATKTNADGIASLGEQIAEVGGKADANAERITEVSGKADANEAKIAEVEGKANANATAIAEVGGKADANVESITEVGGRVTEIEGSITEINGSIETLLGGLAEIDGKVGANTESIEGLNAKFYVTDFSMTAVRTAAATGTLYFRPKEFYSAITSGKLVYIRDYTSSGVGTGACVPQTYDKDGIATAVIYDTVDRKWYTLSAAQSDRNITVTASDTVNLMDNEIYTTDFTMQQLIAALGESDSATWSVSTEGFVAALTARKSIFIPDGNGGGYISLSGSFSNHAVFYVDDSNMFLTIRAVDQNNFRLYRRLFDAQYYKDIESAGQLQGTDGQPGSVPGEMMGQYKVFYRTTTCPTFVISNIYPLRAGEVINLRFIFTAGLGNMAVSNSNFVVYRNQASNPSTDLVPGIVDVTAINPGGGEKIVLFYNIHKYRM